MVCVFMMCGVYVCVYCKVECSKANTVNYEHLDIEKKISAHNKRKLVWVHGVYRCIELMVSVYVSENSTDIVWV